MIVNGFPSYIRFESVTLDKLKEINYFPPKPSSYKRSYSCKAVEYQTIYFWKKCV